MLLPSGSDHDNHHPIPEDGEHEQPPENVELPDEVLVLRKDVVLDGVISNRPETEGPVLDASVAWKRSQSERRRGRMNLDSDQRRWDDEG